MINGLLGKKIGMTQVFDEEGNRIPVTVLEAGPCQVQEIKDLDKAGYCSVKLGYSDTKEKRLNKPQREKLKADSLKPKRYVREIRCEEKPEDVKVGDEISSKMFQKGDYLDITGISKGKGFQGGVKRCGWAGGKETHGSMSHRAPGSIGASSYPSRVVKGHGMPGQMGNERETVQNLEVIDVNEEDNTVAVKGSVPGANGSYLIIVFAKKKPIAEREVVEEEVQEEEAQEAQPEAVQQEAPQEEVQPEAPAEEAPKEEKKEEGKE